MVVASPGTGGVYTLRAWSRSGLLTCRPRSYSHQVVSRKRVKLSTGSPCCAGSKLAVQETARRNEERKLGIYEGASKVASSLLYHTQQDKTCAVCNRALLESKNLHKTCKVLSAQLGHLLATKEAAHARSQSKTKIKQAVMKQGYIIYIRKLKHICMTRRACSACKRQLDSTSSLGPMLSNIDRLSKRMATERELPKR